MLEFDARQFKKNHKITNLLRNLNYEHFYFFDQDFSYYNYRMRNLIFLLVKILFFGVIKNNIDLKKMTDFAKQKNYFSDILYVQNMIFKITNL